MGTSEAPGTAMAQLSVRGLPCVAHSFRTTTTSSVRSVVQLTYCCSLMFKHFRNEPKPSPQGPQIGIDVDRFCDFLAGQFPSVEQLTIVTFEKELRQEVLMAALQRKLTHLKQVPRIVWNANECNFLEEKM